MVEYQASFEKEAKGNSELAYCCYQVIFNLAEPFI